MSSSSDEEYRSYHRAYPLHDAVEAEDMETLTHILRPARRQQQQQPLKASTDGAEIAGVEGKADGGVAAMEEDGGAKTGEGSAGDGGDVEKAAEAADQDGDGVHNNNNSNNNNNNNSNSNNNGAAVLSEDDDDDDDNDGFRPPSVDMEERDQEGCTPLHVALSAKKLNAARLLLECGAGTTRRLEGSTPAHIALSVASVGRHRGFADAALKLLLEHHHDVSVKDDRGQTLLHVAASFGLEDAIATLLQAPGGKELMDSKERLNCRPLHLAALGGHVGATRALIEAGCDTSLSNLHGNTALHLACAKARWGVARVLLDLGKASVAASNKNRQTPAAMASKRGLKIPDTLPELRQEGASSAGDGDGNDTGDNGAPAKRAKTNQTAKWQFRVAGGAGITGAGDGPVAVVAGADATQGAQAVGEEGSAGEGGVVGGGGGGGGGSAAAAAVPRTAVLHHPLCLEHHSCPPIRRSGADPPPENVKRLEVIYNEDSGVLRADEFSSLEWDDNPSRAQLADVLRVHDFNYVEKLERICAKIPDAAGALSHLDGDTAISHNSFEAAMRAAGSVCDAVDRVMTGRNRNAFCAVRPPGHHAGPRGLVTCGNDAQGSHGFCLLNNVAIGAAYARCMHRHTGVDRVAIVDFDVHHGNGTEDIVKALVPKVEEAKIKTPFCQGVIHQVSYNPWLNPEDPDKCLFVSVHGYGKKDREFPGGWFYPGSGATTDCAIPGGSVETAANAGAAAAGGAGAEAEGEGEGGDGGRGESSAGTGARGGVSGVVSAAEREPLVLDVGMPLPDTGDTPGASRHRWRDVYRNDILPKLVAFNPDIILVSAGFDAHKKDVINFGYIGLLEEDYEWVTQQLVQVANRCCEGRLVSVLEGGYRIQGGIVSAFGRSVAGHVRALVDGCESRQEWNATDAACESNFERRLLQERERKRKLKLEQQLRAMEEKNNLLRIAMAQQQQQQQQQQQANEAAAAAAAAAGGGINGDAPPAVTPHGAPAPAGGGDSVGGEEEAAAATGGGESEDTPAKKEGGAGGGGAGGGGGREGERDDPALALPSKRRRTNVDYVALQKKLQEEDKAAGKQETPAADP